MRRGGEREEALERRGSLLPAVGGTQRAARRLAAAAAAAQRRQRRGYALVGGRPARGGSAPRPAPRTASDANVIARLADTARMRNALARHRAALRASRRPPRTPAAAAGDDPPVHPADLAAVDVDSPGIRAIAPPRGPHRPGRHRAVRHPPAPAATVPAVDPELDAQAAQFAELRARAPELAREIVDAALGPRGQVAAYRALAEPGLAAEEQAVARVLQAATDPTAAAQALAATRGRGSRARRRSSRSRRSRRSTGSRSTRSGELQTPGFSAGT